MQRVPDAKVTSMDKKGRSEPQRWAERQRSRLPTEPSPAEKAT